MPQTPSPNMWTPTLDRALLHVRYDHGCWLWTGARNKGGYGTFGKFLAHRVIYELAVGEVDGGALDHLCRNTLCCNPLHLEPVSVAENTRRGSGTIWETRRALRFCKRGHKNHAGGISRWCRQCDRERAPRVRRVKEMT